MNRLWSRVGVRATSVGLLLTGVAGGVYLGQGKEVQQQSVEARLVVQADAAEVDLLKDRSAEHAAARAPQRKAEAEAAEKAATEAKAAAGRARKLEKAAIAKKATEAKAAKEAAEAKKQQADGDDDGGGGPAKPYDGPIPASCGDYSGNRAIGCALLLDAGFGLSEMPCLDKLFKKESGWNVKASNRSSGAYGIPQALPGRKMASAGPNWQSSAETQIKWGLGYIKGRYNSPCGAWSHSRNTGWY